MAKRASTFERQLARLEAIRELGRIAPAELTALLADRQPYIAGAAATLAADLGGDHAALLCAALLRLVRDEQPDDGCLASEPVVDALLRLDANEPDAFRAGLTYVRREPSGIDFVDRAIGVRIACANGLLRCDARAALQDVAPLLCDGEAAVREGVARILGQRRDEGAAAAVHVKLLSGDAEPAVLGACLEALLGIDPDRYLAVVESALDDPRLEELAALALGESRHPKALAALERALEGSLRPAAATLMLAMALLRSDDAIDALLAHVRQSPEQKAIAAVEALTVHRHSAGLAERVQKAARRRGKKLRAAAAKAFVDG